MSDLDYAPDCGDYDEATEAEMAHQEALLL